MNFFILLEEVSSKNQKKINTKPTDGMVSAAQKAINWKEKYKDEVKGGTQIGWTRARQIVNRENLSIKTIKRMKAFFDRHQKNRVIDPKYKSEPWKDRGYVAWLIWGGDAGYTWAKMKVKQFENE